MVAGGLISVRFSGHRAMVVAVLVVGTVDLVVWLVLRPSAGGLGRSSSSVDRRFDSVLTDARAPALMCAMVLLLTVPIILGVLR